MPRGQDKMEMVGLYCSHSWVEKCNDIWRNFSLHWIPGGFFNVVPSRNQFLCLLMTACAYFPDRISQIRSSKTRTLYSKSKQTLLFGILCGACVASETHQELLLAMCKEIVSAFEYNFCKYFSMMRIRDRQKFQTHLRYFYPVSFLLKNHRSVWFLYTLTALCLQSQQPHAGPWLPMLMWRDWGTRGQWKILPKKIFTQISCRG